MAGSISERLEKISDQVNSSQKNKMSDYKFYGWVAKDKNSIGNLSWEEYEPKKWTEDDVDIKISNILPLAYLDSQLTYIFSSLRNLCIRLTHPSIRMGTNELSCSRWP